MTSDEAGLVLARNASTSVYTASRDGRSACGKTTQSTPTESSTDLLPTSIYCWEVLPTALNKRPRISLTESVELINITNDVPFQRRSRSFGPSTLFSSV